MSPVRKFGGTIYVRAIEAAISQSPGGHRGGASSGHSLSGRAVGWLLLLAVFVLGCPPSAPPAAVGPLTCRAKPGKVDLLWADVQNATAYDVLRAQGGTAPSLVSTVTDPVYADFGLTDGVTYTYTVIARNSRGDAPPSPTCSATPNDRGVPPPDQPPDITSTPVVEAFENTVWFYDVVAVDPEGQPVTIDAILVPFGMNFDPATARLSWSPSVSQIGSHAVQVSATDPAGNATVQPFSIDVKDFDDPPTITSAPERFVMVGQTYDYPATAFDPEGLALTWVLAGAPAGMTIGAQTGAVQWTPTAGDVGSTQVTVEVRDPAGNLDAQTYELDVLGVSVQLLSPSGVHTIPAGTTLTLPVTANHPKAQLSGRPLPNGSSLVDGSFSFTPTRDQEGRFDVQFEARLAGARDAELVTIQVTVPNGPPQITALPIQTVDEGQALSFVVTATDPDGDAVTISAPSLGLPNAIFNELTSQLDFTPAFDQQGSYNITFVADDGRATGQGMVQIDVIDVAPPATNLTLVVDPPQSPSFAQTTPITGSVVGQAGPPPTPAPLVFITALAPTEVRQGRSATIVLDGLNTQFVDGQVNAQFGAGVSVDDLRVISPTRLEADISVATDAALGVRQVFANDAGSQVPSVVAFSVTQGAASVTGQIVDPFTNQPVAGATVSVPGTNLFTTTAADGTFTLDGISGGTSQLIVTSPNFEILVVDIALGSNATVSVDVPIGLKALARPFSPGGSLPRAAILASVLDRGVSDSTAVLDVDQAEALIQDTLIVVGGDEVGVIDETGQQLNPNVVGGGMMSLTSEGVEAQALALVGGQVIKLGDLIDTMIDLFDWNPGRPVAPDLIAMLQRAVIEAYADPNDPSNAMALVLFNPGNVLAASPPILTRETPLSRFQAFLMLSSFLIETTESIEEDIDADLLSRGIDPTQVSARPAVSEGGFRLAMGQALGASMDWVFATPAHAQGQTFTPPNQFRHRTVDGRTFRKVFGDIHKAAKAEAIFASIVPAGIAAVSMASAILVGGASAGLAGVVAATGAVTAILDGFLAILWQKYVLGMFLAATLQELSPQAPIPTSSRIEGDKFILEFDQSVTQSVNQQVRAGGSTGTNGLGLNPNLLNYTYQLYLFPDLQSIEEKKARRLSIRPEALGGTKYRFVVPLRLLKIGANYFRIATSQFVRRAETAVLDSKTRVPFDPKSVNPPPNPVQSVLNFGKEVVTKIPFDLNVLEVSNLVANNDAFLNSRYGTDVALFEQRVSNLKMREAVKLNAVNAATHERINQQNASKRFLLNGAFGAQVDEVIDLKDFATSGMHHPSSFQNPSSAGSQEVGRILNLPPGTQPDPATLAEVGKVSAAQEVLDIESVLHEEYKVTKRDFKGLKDKVNANVAAGVGGSTTATIFVVDPVTQTGNFVDVTVPNTAAGATQARQFEFVEQGKISVSQGRMANARVDLDAGVDQILNLRGGGSWAQWKLDLKEEMVQTKDFEFKRGNGIKTQIRADTAETIRREAADLGPNNTAEQTREQAKQRTAAAHAPRSVAAKAAGDTMNAIGIISAVFDPVTAFVQGIQVLESEFSPVHVFIKNPRQSFTKPPVLADPDLNRFGGVLSHRPDPNRVDRNGVIVGGQFVSAYPAHKYTPDLDNTGFPALYLATDSKDRIYAINGRSTTQYGGRIFRWDPADRMLRAFAGSVMYFSTLIQYGRPAAPLGLAVGEYWEASESGPMEDLFVVNTDFIENPPRNEILRVPVHLLERPPYSNGLGVDHVVGQRYLATTQFQFTGPTDIKVMGEIGGLQRLFVTDEDTIWVIHQDLQSPEQPPQLIKLLQEPGRRWSGIAIDARNNVYVADFNSGDLLAMSLSEVQQLEASGGTTCARIVPGLMDQPEYIALDHNEQTLVVSDSDGVHSSIRLPAFVEGLPATKAHLVTLGKQSLLSFTTRPACADYRILFPEAHHVEEQGFSLRFNAPGLGISKEVRINLPAFGATGVLDANQLLQDFPGYFQ